MRNLVFGALALFLMTACSSKNIEIAGTLKGAGTTKVYLNKIQDGAPVVLDTVDVTNDKFEVEIAKMDAQLLLLFIEGKQEPVVFFGGNGNVSIEGDVEKLQDVLVSGSDETDLFYKLNKEIPGMERSKAIREDYMKAQQSMDTALMSQYRKEFDNIMAEQKVYFDSFITANTNSPVGAFLLIQMAASFDAAKTKDLIAKFEVSLKEHVYVAELKNLLKDVEAREVAAAEYAKILENVAVGKTVPEISLLNNKKTQVSLSSLKGKYVLVDFWASWCKPCRVENINTAKLYEKYSKKGFEVFAISTDQDEKAWVEALATDNYKWIQVRDTMGVVAQQFGVQQLPTTFLIDKEGIIIAHDLRGDDLAAKLAELLK